MCSSQLCGCRLFDVAGSYRGAFIDARVLLDWPKTRSNHHGRVNNCIVQNSTRAVWSLALGQYFETPCRLSSERKTVSSFLCSLCFKILVSLLSLRLHMVREDTSVSWDIQCQGFPSLFSHLSFINDPIWDPMAYGLCIIISSYTVVISVSLYWRKGFWENDGFVYVIFQFTLNLTRRFKAPFRNVVLALECTLFHFVVHRDVQYHEFIHTLHERAHVRQIPWGEPLNISGVEMPLFHHCRCVSESWPSEVI